MIRVRLLLVALALLLCPSLQAQPASESLERGARRLEVREVPRGRREVRAVRHGLVRRPSPWASQDAGGVRHAEWREREGGPGNPARGFRRRPLARDRRAALHARVPRAMERREGRGCKGDSAGASRPGRAEAGLPGEDRGRTVRRGVYDLGNYPQDKLDRDAWALLAQAYEKAGRSDQAALARRRALGEPVPIVPLRPPLPSRRPCRARAPRRPTSSRSAARRSTAATLRPPRPRPTASSRSSPPPARATGFSETRTPREAKRRWPTRCGGSRFG